MEQFKKPPEIPTKIFDWLEKVKAYQQKATGADPDKSILLRPRQMLRRAEAQGYVVDEKSITCLTCGKRSFHPTDIREKYCGNCHKFHERTRADG